MKSLAICCLLMTVTLAVSPTYAQEQLVEGQDQVPLGIDLALADPVPPPLDLRGVAIGSGISTFTPSVGPPQVSVRRPAPSASIAMYSIYGMLQVLDVHSTQQALGENAVEANPILRPFASSAIGLMSIKAASSAGVMYLMERVRKKHPAAALALAIGINSLQAMVVVHNYRIARR